MAATAEAVDRRSRALHVGTAAGTISICFETGRVPLIRTAARIKRRILVKFCFWLFALVGKLIGLLLLLGLGFLALVWLVNAISPS